MVLSVTAVTSAHAGGIGVLSCVGGARSFNCAAQWGIAGDPYVRGVPEALGEAEKAQAVARDRKWQAHCGRRIADVVTCPGMYLATITGSSCFAAWSGSRYQVSFFPRNSKPR